MTFKKDSFSRARGASRFLDITCSKCANHICYYQKDGPGILKRMYLDRIVGSSYQELEHKTFSEVPKFTCPACKELLGTPMIYEKEKRLAFRLFVGAVVKKIVKGETLN